MKVGVIGSGLAGLSATWYLSKFARVDILEKEASIGIDAHSVDLDLKASGQFRIDTPLRVLKAGYYPNLLRLYDSSLIPTELIDYSGSFSNPAREPYFRYQNLPLGRNSYPYLANWFSLARTGRRILADLFRFYRNGPGHLGATEVQAMDFGTYLKRHGYSTEFCERFILPVFAAINTCSYGAVKEYPATTIIGYLMNSRKPSGVRRIVGGVGNVARTLGRAASEVQCGRAVEHIEQQGEQVTVTAGGTRQVYDFVILSTQANQAARICGNSLPHHRAILEQFQYEKSDLIVHSDASFLPNKRSAWSPVNFVVDPTRDKPMATMYMNAIQKELPPDQPILQTWNPHEPPAEEHLIARAAFERPLVTGRTEATLQLLRRLNEDPNNRVKICGSYTEIGIPLLEAAAVSGEKAAGIIAAQEPAIRTAGAST